MNRLLPHILLLLLPCLSLQAQTARDLIEADRYFAAGNYRVYPTPDESLLTAPPAGKRPFYISHYGRHGSRYLNSKKGYTIPYKILHDADSLGRLTPLGQDVLRQLSMIIADSHERWGDLSALGQQQQRDIARRMMLRCPEVFEGEAHVQARSTTVNRCMLSMGSALQQLVSMNPRLHIDMNASLSDMWYMNHQDKQLRDSMMPSRAKRAFSDYCRDTKHNDRLIALLFNDTTGLSKKEKDVWLNYYLLKTELIQQNTGMHRLVSLSSLFTADDCYHLWQQDNAWWYICYGPSLLNGGRQPYTQRYLLRQLIADADSCLRLDKPGVQLRFGHETIVLPLVCLMGINGYDFQTLDLTEAEQAHWWSSLVIPMAANVQLVFYRSDPHDDDVVFKVLLNEHEATLPLPTDMAPYYHWRDFREFFLRKLAAYEQR